MSVDASVGSSAPAGVPVSAGKSGLVRAVPGMLRDEAAPSFEAVFHGSYTRLVRSISVACGNPELAADLVQQAFMQLWADWARVSRYASPSAWVTRVAVSRLRDHQRSLRHLASALLRLEREPQPSPPVDGLDSRMSEALAHLPLRQRIAVVLFYVDDRSTAEVATIMGVSEGTVKRHLFRAREALRSVLKES
jgi:RNA polymerase sigma-70 factor (ECF subfamily)